MARTAATITMSMREVDRVKTVQAVVDRMLPVGLAAKRLGLSRRQLERLLLKYGAYGAAGLVSAKRGHPSNHQLAPGAAERALRIIRDRYADFGPTLACEKLRECHGLVLAKETVRSLMTAAGLWKPRRQRAAPIHQPRNRRACLGELVQIDGSDHAWFEGRGPACTLLVFIDDATGRLMQLHFTPTSRPPAPISRRTGGRWLSTATRRASSERRASRPTSAARDPVRPRPVLAQRRHSLRQFEPGQGARGTGQSDAAGPVGQGAEAGQERNGLQGSRFTDELRPEQINATPKSALAMPTPRSGRSAQTPMGTRLPLGSVRKVCPLPLDGRATVIAIRR